MAVNKRTSAPNLLGDDDLRVVFMWPYWGSFIGTEAQLRAEGLIPEGMDMPPRSAPKSWTIGDVRYTLCRKQRAKHVKWIDGDWWDLSTRLLTRKDDCENGWDIRDRDQRRQRECWVRARAHCDFRRCLAASNDGQVQAILNAAQQVVKA